MKLVEEYNPIKKRKAVPTLNSDAEPSKRNPLVIDINDQKFSVNPTITFDPSGKISEMFEAEFKQESNRPVRNLATYASLPSYSPTPKKEESEEEDLLSYSPSSSDIAEDRQGSGPQIPILSQTLEMSQDPSQSFAFE